MRLVHWLVGSTAALAACAQRGAPVLDAPPAPLPLVRDWAVLDAPVAGGAVRFSLARAAYVAVFDVAPGEGVRLLYPAAAPQAALPLDGGVHTRAARRGARHARLVGLTSAALQPRYLYLVASDRPLALEEPLRWSGGELTSPLTLAGRRFSPRSASLDETLEALYDAVVVEGGDVDTDVLEYYPDVRLRRGDRTLALSAFRCYDGRVVYATPGGADDYSVESWYGIDPVGGRYVGPECYLGYVARGVGAAGAPVAAVPASGSGRPAVRTARDARPSIPVTAEELRPSGPGGTAPAGRAERIDAAPAVRPPATSHPRPRPPHPPAPDVRPDAPEPRPEPRAEPRPEPADHSLREPAGDDRSRAGHTPDRAAPGRDEPAQPTPRR